MTNAELIKALKDAEGYIRYVAPSCIASDEAKEAIRDAADALEAAEQRIAELEKQNKLKDGTITAMATDIGKLQAQLQTVTNCHTLEEGNR